MKHTILLTGLAATVLVVLALATSTAVDVDAEDLDTVDELFIVAAVHVHLYTLEASRLALERSASLELRRFVQRVQGEHTRYIEQLSEIAGQRGIFPPQTTTAQYQLMTSYLAALERGNFGAAYLEQHLWAHEAAIAMLTRQLELSRDEDVRAFAAAALPDMQEHLLTAHTLLDSMHLGSVR